MQKQASKLQMFLRVKMALGFGKLKGSMNGANALSSEQFGNFFFILVPAWDTRSIFSFLSWEKQGITLGEILHCFGINGT